MIYFEYLILAFDKLILWTATGKKDKINARDEILSAMENHRIDLLKIKDEKTLQYLSGFKRFSTERVMKSLAGELPENEKWSIKGTLMGRVGIRTVAYQIIKTIFDAGNRNLNLETRK